jgi:hypothetical protein
MKLILAFSDNQALSGVQVDASTVTFKGSGQKLLANLKIFAQGTFDEIEISLDQAGSQEF